MPASIAGRNARTTNLNAAEVWTGDRISLFRDTGVGDAAVGDIFTGFYHCEGRTSTWWVEGSDDGATWLVIATGNEAAHVAGAAGKSIECKVPAKFGRLRVQNTGAGATTTFNAFAQFTAY